MNKNNNEYNGLNKDKKELLKSLMGAASSKEVDFNKILESWEEDSIFNRDTELTEEGLDNLISQMERAKQMPKHKSNIDIEENMKEGKKALDRFLENRNRIITIREDKVEEFLNQKRDDKMWEKIKERAARFRKNNMSSISNDKFGWDIVESILKKAIENGISKEEIRQEINRMLNNIGDVK
ncbi:hypothetical protein ACSXDM_15705 (plasmid) [Clostridium perfringens]